MAHLLARGAPRHLAPSLLRAGEELGRAAAPAPALAAAVQNQLLLAVRLWAAAPPPTHRNLLALMLQLAKVPPWSSNPNHKPKIAPPAPRPYGQGVTWAP